MNDVEKADTVFCSSCGDEVLDARARLGYTTCTTCGDTQARKDRDNWTVVQEYGKGGYQFVTAESARATLRQTNQKQPR